MERTSQWQNIIFSMLERKQTVELIVCLNINYRSSQETLDELPSFINCPIYRPVELLMDVTICPFSSKDTMVAINPLRSARLSAVHASTLMYAKPRLNNQDKNWILLPLNNTSCRSSTLWERL
ncbi:hypothetical protein PIROE2DRAFT_9608 [Piromyces sp. E2]|nr:hypothetical protein PIROE2DRAFT_9608 [Piromyces sp. E2]|eukprot:OUM63807.1 hypothetical protein PIROE2DRAFT_9608 [Piromyces sp. E2]